ncbi:hypothetical protein SUGI_0671560 [Cryptomeria japonica]|nr:hypothetical protein SUGI_0671560 [Cryptomeria japonica]
MSGLNNTNIDFKDSLGYENEGKNAPVAITVSTGSHPTQNENQGEDQGTYRLVANLVFDVNNSSLLQKLFSQRATSSTPIHIGNLDPPKGLMTQITDSNYEDDNGDRERKSIIPSNEGLADPNLLSHFKVEQSLKAGVECGDHNLVAIRGNLAHVWRNLWITLSYMW